MADYSAIADSQVEPGAPGTTDLFNQLRDNPLAMFEGAAGAPRLQDAALSGTVTTAGSSWVGARYAGIAWNGVGATVQAVIADITTPGSTPVIQGEEVSGLLLSPSNAEGETNTAITLPGTWACAGRIANRNQTTAIKRTAQWRRVR